MPDSGCAPKAGKRASVGWMGRRQNVRVAEAERVATALDREDRARAAGLIDAPEIASRQKTRQVGEAALEAAADDQFGHVMPAFGHPPGNALQASVGAAYGKIERRRGKPGG